jgi:archaellin
MPEMKKAMDFIPIVYLRDPSVVYYRGTIYAFSTMKKIALVIVVVVAAVAAYYLIGPGRMASVTVALAAQSGSGETGTALLEDVSGQVRVTVSVQNQPAGSTQPAHIHVGSCPTPGDVVYPLTSLTGGSSTTMINTTIAELKARGPLAINLHKSAAQSKVYVACGNIEF